MRLILQQFLCENRLSTKGRQESLGNDPRPRKLKVAHVDQPQHYVLLDSSMQHLAVKTFDASRDCIPVTRLLQIDLSILCVSQD